ITRGGINLGIGSVALGCLTRCVVKNGASPPHTSAYSLLATVTFRRPHSIYPESLDVNPLIRPRWSTISDERKGKRNEQGQAHGSADHRRAEAGGSGGVSKHTIYAWRSKYGGM